ncbi:MAG: hypothetical protein J7647_09535 [Cyanobacteria bacterium SBLK]|nr:hypothetical protein [Cyanobacteria bacterium SBLK]
MSYWVWLARMVLFGLMGGASVTFLLRVSPPRNLQGNRSEDKVLALDIEQVLPSEYNAVRNYSQTSNLPAFPDPSESRLEPILDEEEKAAIAKSPLADLPKPAPVLPNALEPSKTPETEKPTKETETKNQESSSASTSSPQPKPKSSASNLPRSRSQLSSRSSQSKPTPQSSQSKPKPSSTQTYVVRRATPRPRPSFNLNQSIIRHSELFASSVSLGMLAIGVAEGNYRVFAENNTLYVEQTANYFGHTDPGNLSWGERVTNYGPCSDQGRSGGNIKRAEQMCSKRALDRLPTNLRDLYNAGINPDYELEAVLNTADLYNQASPIHSRRFPQALAIAKQGGLNGLEAIAWARTASFYLNPNNELDLESGRNRASGLLGICARERRGVTEWDCVYRDQMRRVRAIALVLDKYFTVYRPR